MRQIVNGLSVRELVKPPSPNPPTQNIPVTLDLNSTNLRDKVITIVLEKEIHAFPKGISTNKKESLPNFLTLQQQLMLLQVKKNSSRKLVQLFEKNLNFTNRNYAY